MKFPKRNIDVSLYQAEVKTLLNDNQCAYSLIQIYFLSYID